MTEAGSKKKKSGKLKWIIVLVILAAAAGAVLMFFKKPAAFPQMSGERTVEASKMTIEKTLESDGEVKSALEENILPHTSYYLAKINVEEGEAVKEGDTILTYTNGYTMTTPYNCVVKSWSLPDLEDQLTSDHYVTVAGTDVLEMEMSLSDSEVLQLSVGDSAKVTVDAVDSTYEAEVTYISEVGEYSSGSSTFTAKVTFDNDGKLKLGMSGSAVVSLEKAEDVIAVPADAVSRKGGVSFVTVPGDGDNSSSQVEVETGITNGTFTEIKSGLNEGDKVIVKTSDDSSDWRDQMGGPGGFSGFPDGEPPSGFDGAPPSGGSGGGSKPDFPGGGSGNSK